MDLTYDVELLCRAAISGQADKVAQLLQKNPDLACIRVDGIGPMAHAAHEGYVDVVRLFVEHGCPPDQTCSQGMRAIDNAILGLGDPGICPHTVGKIAVVEYLMSKGQMPSIANLNRELHFTTDLRVVKFLMSLGVPIDDRGIAKYQALLNAASGQSSRATTREKQDSCYIATACYGSYDHSDVRVLRRFRDEHLLPSPIGKHMVTLYYTVSPKLAAWIGRNRLLSKIIRQRFLEPLVRRLGG